MDFLLTHWFYATLCVVILFTLLFIAIQKFRLYKAFKRIDSLCKMVGELKKEKESLLYYYHKNEQRKKDSLDKKLDREEQARQEELKKEYEKSFDYKQRILKESELSPKKSLLHWQETQIYKTLIFDKDLQRQYTIFSQVPLKAFIQHTKNADDPEDPHNKAWQYYSNLYVDFLFCKRDFKTNILTPFAVLEYNGGGHYGKDESDKEHIKENDEIKSLTVQKANLKFFVVSSDEICDTKSYIDDNKLSYWLDGLKKQLDDDKKHPTTKKQFNEEQIKVGDRRPLPANFRLDIYRSNLHNE